MATGPPTASCRRCCKARRAVSPNGVKSRQTRRQVSSSPVKFCQATSRLVKALVDRVRCDFNGLPRTSLTPGRVRSLWRPTPLRPFTGDEARIARLSISARICPLHQARDAGRRRRREFGGERRRPPGSLFFPRLCFQEVGGLACGGEGRSGSGREGSALDIRGQGYSGTGYTLQNIAARLW
jgi:hypothetical protein